jgi:hypothetical protein
MKFFNVDINSIKIKDQTVSKVYGGNNLLYSTQISQQKLLDIYTDAIGAYSLYSLNSSYTGPIIQVRRSSDNQENNFYADDINNGNLLSWVNNSEGFISRWYDQSGNGKHAIQNTANLQPKIVSSNSITNAQGIISPYYLYNQFGFSLPNVSSANNSISVCCFVNHPVLNSTQTYVTIGNAQWAMRHDGVSTVGQFHCYFRTDSTLKTDFRLNNQVASNTWSFFTTTWDGSTARAYKNSSSIGSYAPGGSLTPDSSNGYIGSNTDVLGGYITDILIFHKTLSSADIANIYNNYIIG